MALIKCPECGQEISDTASACIHCGYRLNASSKTRKFNKANIAWIIAAIFTGFILLKNSISVFFFSSPFTGAMLVGQLLLVAGIWVLALVAYVVIRLLTRQ